MTPTNFLNGISTRRKKMDQSPHKSDFVNMNGIRLHYLDWGGSGPVMLFLAGLGCNAHIFDQLAPRFTDHFHVLALTRRGHGESDYPETGYDIDTLTEDIRLFLDTLQIDLAVLVGHSMAGLELSHFSALYPHRIQKLVLLDAGYYRSSPECKAIYEKDPMKDIDPPDDSNYRHTISDYVAYLKKTFPHYAAIWGEAMHEQFLHEVKLSTENGIGAKVVYKRTAAITKAFADLLDTYVPEDTKIQAPVLNIYAIRDNTYFVYPAYMTEEQQAQVVEYHDTVLQPYYRFCIEQFRRNVPHAKIVEIPSGHHYCFIQQEELVFNEMRTFLLDT
jgi:pimeloyl-ACP methyl ester carboxylesterase